MFYICFLYDIHCIYKILSILYIYLLNLTCFINVTISINAYVINEETVVYSYQLLIMIKYEYKT